jgi:hypothetical protein
MQGQPTAKYKKWPPIVARAAEIVEEYETAVTLRQMFYRLFAEDLIDNIESDYKKLSHLTARARREGTFPPLMDRTRLIERVQTFTSPAEALAVLARGYRRDLLDGQESLPMIVVEKATLVAQVRSWFDALTIPVAALRGYASESLERDILDFVDVSTKPVVLLYCGDFDPSGEDIPRAFEATTGLTLKRVALTPEQVEEYELPEAMGKATDTRAASFHARHGRLVQVELEALPPEILRDLLTAELDLMLDTTMMRAQLEREKQERRQLDELAEQWREQAEDDGLTQG